MSPVSDREFLESIVAHERELREQDVQHERDLREQAERSAAHQLGKQAAEYERRLTDLNHSHARSLQDKAEFLQKSLYDQTQADFQEWKLGVATDLAAREARIKESQRLQGLLLTMLSLGVGLAAFLLGRAGP